MKARHFIRDFIGLRKRARAVSSKKYSDELYDMDQMDESIFTIDENYDIPELNFQSSSKARNRGNIWSRMKPCAIL